MKLDMAGFETWFLKVQFGAKERERVYRKISSFLRNGVSLPDTLRTIYLHATDDGRKPKNPQAVVVKAWLERIANGQSFGRAVTGWVPDSDRIIIEAGETAGNLADALENAMFIQQSAKKIKGAILAGIAYPMVLMVLAVGLLLIFGDKIVPAFSTVLPRSKWTGTPAFMGNVADFVNTGMFPCLFALGVVIGVMLWSMPRWVGKYRVYADRFVPWSLYRLTMGAGFMLSVSALVKAGVQVPEILRILMRGSKPWYYERTSKALMHVNNGVNIGEALYRSKMDFPDKETVKDLRAYAGFDNFDETLELLGRQWVEESVDKVRAQMAVLKNLSLVVLGIVFGVIAVGIFALQQQVAANL
jgi:type II secretory pathway component PulF